MGGLSHRFEAAELAIGSRWTCHRSGGAQLSGLVLDEASAARPLAKRSENYDAWLFVEHSSAKARREKAPDD
jgi:hypothetical protein